MISDCSLSTEKINAHLTENASALISKLELFKQIDSTNRYLMTATQTNAASGSVCFAETQIAGKGRRGREWISPQGQNIYGSFLWRFNHIEQLNGLSLAIGVGVIRTLNKCGAGNVGLKWPNDIYSDGKKLGGILIEVTTHSNGEASAVIGFGLNLNLPPNLENITQAYTNLHEVAPNVEWERNRLIACLLNELLPITSMFEKKGLNAYLKEWRSYDCLLNKSVSLFVGTQKISGVVQGIDENGLLKLQRSNGVIQTFASGEVSFSA